MRVASCLTRLGAATEWLAGRSSDMLASFSQVVAGCNSHPASAGGFFPYEKSGQVEAVADVPYRLDLCALDLGPEPGDRDVDIAPARVGAISVVLARPRRARDPWRERILAALRIAGLAYP